MPALPLEEAGRYVAGAYIVFVMLLVIYVGLMAVKLARISRDLEELVQLAERGEDGSAPAAVPRPASAAPAEGGRR